MVLISLFVPYFSKLATLVIINVCFQYLRDFYFLDWVEYEMIETNIIWNLSWRRIYPLRSFTGNIMISVLPSAATNNPWTNYVPIKSSEAKYHNFSFSIPREEKFSKCLLFYGTTKCWHVCEYHIENTGCLKKYVIKSLCMQHGYQELR